MKSHPSAKTLHPGQHLQMLDEVKHDPYLDRMKLPEPSLCSECGAIYGKGRWKWGAPPDNAHPILCPACKRIHDNLPAGYVSIQGTFPDDYAQEILSLVQHFADHEKLEHPLKRIMSITKDAGGYLITTTDIHLARGIGEAIQKSHKGTLDYHYNPAEYLLRVRWER